MNGLSGIGEVQGGLGRFFGGVSRAELLRRIWVPITGSNPALANIGSHVGVLIDAAGELGRMELDIPENFTVLRGLVCRVISMAAGDNLMNFDVSIDYGQPDAPYNQHTLANQVVQRTVTLNDLNYIVLDALVGAVADFQANDTVGITVQHEAAGGGGIATNAVLLGALLDWE